MAISREHILSEIRRTAQDNDGKPLGKARFQEQTGIRELDVTRYWARWGDAVSEAGLQPNAMQARYDDETVMQLLAGEVRRLGRFPTVVEMRLRRREDSSFPAYGVFAKYGTQPEIAAKVVEWCRDRPDEADVLAIVAAAATPRLESPAEVSESVTLGYVYLMKSGRYHKVGRSNSAGRREYEVSLQLPEPVKLVHTIKTDDPVGIEAYWHRRFADRRKNGEWFDLTTADVAAFRRRKFM